MADRVKVEMERLRDIGWRLWDPIGLAEAGSPRDEYDGYLRQVVGQLENGTPVDQVIQYLDGVPTERMGLGPSTELSRQSAERTVLAIQTYLESLRTAT